MTVTWSNRQSNRPVLNAAGQPHQRLRYAEPRALFGGNGGMGHDRGMFDQTFDATETFGEGEELRRSRTRRAGEVA